MNRHGEAAEHSATTAGAAMLYLPYLRYLRRPAARKIVSSETGGSLASLSFTPMRRHKFVLGSMDWSGRLSP
jgi:hypothetical protein